MARTHASRAWARLAAASLALSWPFNLLRALTPPGASLSLLLLPAAGLGRGAGRERRGLGRGRARG